MESKFYEENSRVIVHGSHRSRDPFVLCGVHTSIYSENAKTRVAITVVVGVKTNSASTQSLSKKQRHSILVLANKSAERVWTLVRG